MIALPVVALSSCTDAPPPVHTPSAIAPTAHARTASGSAAPNNVFESGVATLRKAAATGNIYAYYGLSEAYNGDTPQKSLVESAAYLRLAYLLGDRKASAAIAQRGLSGIENVVADERAAALYQTFAKSPRPSPRPFE
ncbi:hypothetical protein [Xanthomonas euvesicatoria]|uniref:hypothetical protein n=1 Tax=Xanthomonas euvesicatoria TaxID=456327 RepID=UPI001C489A79|nr:hypothetical protein [Xanthomonas euvesicatoria]MBV6830536.1 hypothetical protein [Xanthomonas campestris pv. viegasii]